MATLPLHDLTFEGIDNVYTIPQAASELPNDSTNVSGSTVANALDNLAGTIDGLSASDIANDSQSIGGTTVKDALENLTATDIANSSTNVTGTTVKDALDTLDAAIDGLTASDIANDASDATGSTVADALDNLDSAVDTLSTTVSGLGSSNIANNSSNVTGTNVTNALDNLNTKIDDLTSDDIANSSINVEGANVSEALDNIDNRVAMFGRETRSASGSVATFDADVGGMPLQSCIVNIEPVQSGTGDPSPSNIRPISGWTGVNITRRGKNLIRVAENFNLASISESFTELYPVTSPVIPGGTVLSVDYIENPSKTSAMITAVHPDGTSTILYMQERERVIQKPISRITIANWSAATGILAYVQLELGSAATSYEPYMETSYPIIFPTSLGTVYGGTLDILGGRLTVDKSMVTFDGTENWALNKTNEYRLANSYGWKRASNGGNGLSNIIAWRNTTNPNYYYNLSDQIYLGWQNGGTVTEFKALLASFNSSGTPLTIIHDLDTPITYSLTPTEITTLLGTNNIQADTGDISVIYGNYLNSLKMHSENYTDSTVYDLKNSTELTGNLISFDSDVGNVPLKKCEVSLEPIQDLHGFDRPWGPGGGKNLLPWTTQATKNVGDTVVSNGITFTILGDNDGNKTGVSVYGTSTANARFTFAEMSYADISKLSGKIMTMGSMSGAFILRIEENGGDYQGVSATNSNPNVIIPSFTETSNTFSIWIRVSNGSTVNPAISFYPIIYDQSLYSDSSFEPYTNICPIEGHTGLVARSFGKNMFVYPTNPADKDVYRATTTKISDNSFYLTGSNGNEDVPKLDVAPWAVTRSVLPYVFDEDVQVTISCKIHNYTANCNGVFRLAETTNFPVSSAETNITNTNYRFNDVGIINFSGTGVFHAGKKLVLIMTPASSGSNVTLSQATEVYDIQLEFGSVATSYEPTKAVDAMIPSSIGTVYSGTLDVLSGRLTANWAKYTVTGAEAWTAPGNSQTPSNATRFDLVVSDFPAASSLYDVACSHYLTNGETNTPGVWVNPVSAGATELQLRVSTTAYSNVNDFKAYLVSEYSAGHPVEFVYKLDTPVVYKLTPQEVKCALGENYIWTNNAQVSIERGAQLEATNDRVDRMSRNILNSIGDPLLELLKYSSTTAPNYITLYQNVLRVFHPNILFRLPSEKTFDGSTDYIDTGIRLAEKDIDFTITLYEKNNASIAHTVPIFHCINESGSPYPGISLQSVSSFGAYGLGGIKTGQTNTGGSVAKDAVNKFVIRHAASSMQYRIDLSVNGVRQTRIIESVEAFARTNKNLLIGCYQNGSGVLGRFWAGTIYEFTIYNNVLSDSVVDDYIAGAST